MSASNNIFFCSDSSKYVNISIEIAHHRDRLANIFTRTEKCNIGRFPNICIYFTIFYNTISPHTVNYSICNATTF